MFGVVAMQIELSRQEVRRGVAPRAVALDAVSYTHLDVYKRQADDIAAQHPQGLGLFHGQKTAADDNIIARIQLF